MNEHHQQRMNKQDSNKALWITGIVITILLIGLITNGFGFFNKTSSNSTANGNIPLSIGSSPVLGNENAPVTIYEFSDFSCPYCAAAVGYNLEITAQFKAQNPSWTAPIPGIIENYVSTGKAKLVFKYTSGHGAGTAAHKVAFALNDQNPDLFWKFHDLAFANQNDVGDLEKMKALAESIGADMPALNTYLDSNKATFLMQQDSQMSEANGVTGTPTFFINGKIVEGAVSYSTIKSIIDKELA